jgi:molybdopterin synthase sulfur carrier subunit
MPLTISYFAWVRERMGRSGEIVDCPPDVTTIAELADWLAARDSAGAAAFADPARIRAALDGAMVPLDTPLADGRELSLFPPVTGG